MPGTVIMEPVSSASVKAVGYDPDSRTAYIEFNNGSRYAYKNVSQTTYDALRAAPSIGKFVSIFKNTYRGERV